MPNPATPRALKLIRGNPGKRSLNKREPQPEVKEPHCPDHLDEAARLEWKRMVPILLSMRVLTEADYMALSVLCQQFANMAQAQKQLNQTGNIYKTPNGNIRPSPLIGIIRESSDLAIKICREFGLTPSARSRVSTSNPAETNANPWDEL